MSPRQYTSAKHIHSLAHAHYKHDNIKGTNLQNDTGNSVVSFSLNEKSKGKIPNKKLAWKSLIVGEGIFNCT